jgi:glycosyltransferase involved in cell wall biosynthesis
MNLFRNGLRFAPVGSLKLGVYDGLQLHVPSVTDVVAAARKRGCDAVHISTPGPMGLLGLVVARELGVPAYGTFHTDFPAYATQLTGDYRLEAAAWRYMRWFYGQLDRIAAPSESTREKLVWNGIDADKIAVVGRGIRTEKFSPAHRNFGLRALWGDARQDWMLYVGRISREKIWRASSRRSATSPRSEKTSVWL